MDGVARGGWAGQGWMGWIGCLGVNKIEWVNLISIHLEVYI